MLFCLIGIQAQTTISGKVADTKGNTIPFANVYLAEVYDGATTDEQGNFSFQTQAEGEAILVISYTGYLSYQQPLRLNGQTYNLQITLQENAAELSPVVISAGSFEASDEKKMALLKSLDIVTTAGTEGDIARTLQTLPGVSLVGDETGIFVRGGEAQETQTLINGMRVSRPFFSDLPELASRSRFDPFMFKGIMFSTGGYSAEYGQALSSVLLLNTQDIPESSSANIGFNLAGANVSRTQRFGETTALLADIGYTDLRLLHNIVDQNVDWRRNPQGMGGQVAFRHKSKQGMYKTLVQYQNSEATLQTNDLNTPLVTSPFGFYNQNLYTNSTYQGILSPRWELYAGLAYSYDSDDLAIDQDEVYTKEHTAQARLRLGTDLNDNIYLKFGGESNLLAGDYGFNALNQTVEDVLSVAFTEVEIDLSQKLKASVGVRAEYASLLKTANLAPRSSLAYKTGKDSQISFAYGWYYQRPANDFLRQFPNLDFHKAVHYIFNYQWLQDDYTFRVEGYYKSYEQLIRNRDEEVMPFDNTGTGYATGLDFFWRDRKSIKKLDYRITYSLLLAERDYLDYPEAATPPFVNRHNLNVVMQYQLLSSRFRLGSTYTFASGRPYFNPNTDRFLEDTAPDYHNLSFNLSYLTYLFDQFSVIYASVRNPLGFNQIYSYRFSEDGTQREAVRPGATTSFFLGFSISIE